MGEERIPTGFELMRENARMMLERTSPSDPTTQAMEDVAENVNSMDLATRDLLGKLTKRLEDLANQSSSSSSKQAKVLESLAKDAANEFGRVYASAGGITGEDIEKLSQELAETVAAEVPAGVEREAEAVREVTEEFASRLTEAMEGVEETTSVVEKAMVGGRAPRPSEVPPEVSIEKRERREEMKANLGREKGLFAALGDRIVDGSLSTAKWALDMVLGSLGFVVGGVIALRDEIKAGLTKVWEGATAQLTWLKENWTKIPEIIYRGVKRGLEWLWEKMVVIKDWVKDGIKELPKMIVDYAKGLLPEVLGGELGVEDEGEKKLAQRVLHYTAAGLKQVVPFGPTIHKASEYVARKVGLEEETGVRPITKVGLEEETGVRPITKVGLEEETGVRPVVSLPSVVGVHPTEVPTEGVTAAAEQDLQVRAATTSVGSTRELTGIEKLLEQVIQLQRRWGDREQAGGAEMPAIFDGIGAPDSQGLTGAAAGVVLGGMQ